MAGLLDAQDAALLALGTGLLGGGTFAQALGRGWQGFLSTYAAMQQAQQEKALKERELAMQEELRKAQIQDYLSQAAHRKSQDEAAATQQGVINSLYQRLASPQAPIGVASSVLQSGANAGSVGPTMANAANLPDLPIGEKLNIIDALAVAGAKNTDTLLKTLQYRNEPQKREAGAAYKNLITGEVEYGPPKLPEGLRMNQAGAVEAAPNAIHAIAQLEGARAEEIERRKGKYTFQTRQKPDGTADTFTTTQYADLLNGPPNLPGMQTPGLIGTPAQIIEQARRDAKTPEGFNNFMTFFANQLAGGQPVGQAGGMPVQSELDKAAGLAKIQTEGSTATSANKAVIDNLQASKSKADTAVRNIATLDRLGDAMDSGKLMIGPGSQFTQYGLQLANVMGIAGDSANERLSNTRKVLQGLAQMSIDAAEQLKGQGQITENERALLEKASSAKINEVTVPEMRTLIDIYNRASRLQIASHSEAIKRAESIPGLSNFLPTVRVDAPKQRKRSIDEIMRQYGG